MFNHSVSAKYFVLGEYEIFWAQTNNKSKQIIILVQIALEKKVRSNAVRPKPENDEFENPMLGVGLFYNLFSFSFLK